jgi:hypothetical protein
MLHSVGWRGNAEIWANIGVVFRIGDFQAYHRLFSFIAVIFEGVEGYGYSIRGFGYV